MIGKFLRWLETRLNRPEAVLEREYRDLQDKMYERRNEHAQLIVDEVQLRTNIERAGSDQSKVSTLTAELLALRQKKELAAERLSEIEEKFQRAYTKKQVSLAQRKALGETMPVSRELKIIFAILAIWILIGFALKLKDLF